MSRTLFLGLVMLMTATACSPQDQGEDEPAATPTPVASPLAAPLPVPSGSDTGDLLPLDPGVYVLADAGCENPPNAAFRRYDGRGIGGASTRACVAEVLSQAGPTWHLRQSCEDTYSRERTSWHQTLAITSRTSFTLAEGDEPGMALRLCPALKLADYGG